MQPYHRHPLTVNNRLGASELRLRDRRLLTETSLERNRIVKLDGALDLVACEPEREDVLVLPGEPVRCLAVGRRVELDNVGSFDDVLRRGERKP